MLTPDTFSGSVQQSFRRSLPNPAALRRRAIDVAAGLDLQGAPAVAAAVLIEVVNRDAGFGMSDRAFEAWLGAVAHIRPAWSPPPGRAPADLPMAAAAERP